MTLCAFIYPCHLAYISPCQCLSLRNLWFLEIKATYQKLVFSSSKHKHNKHMQNTTRPKNTSFWHEILTPPEVNHCYTYTWVYIDQKTATGHLNAPWTAVRSCSSTSHLLKPCLQKEHCIQQLLHSHEGHRLKIPGTLDYFGAVKLLPKWGKHEVLLLQRQKLVA